MLKLPIALIYSRLAIGIAIICLSLMHLDNYRGIAIFLLTFGFLTDVFDGIIARQIGVSTVELRRRDSAVDQFFFIAFAVATFIQCPEFFKAYAVELIVSFLMEAATYLVCYLKFRMEIATHSLGAKLWTILILLTLVEVIWRCNSQVMFQICFWVGILTRLEIIAIIIALRKWTNDVPSLYHAVKLRQGKTIKRNKLFNG